MGNKDLKDTYSCRPNAYLNTRRMLKQKPNRYAVFTWTPRQEMSLNESNVGEILNELIKYACTLCGITKNITWTNIRHTAFRLTLEDRPELRDDLDSFADNGRTSKTMLIERYLH